MKKLFWKTYRAEARNVKGDLKAVSFLRGFEWDVVTMADEWATKKGEDWVLYDLRKI